VHFRENIHGYTQTLTVVIELENGKSFNAILQDIQVHPVSDKFYILTFQLFDDKEITMEVPVKVVGTSKGVLAGGVYV
jgi:large subunit ribosomal protein L25